MIPSVSEIIVLMVIVICIVGANKTGVISQAIGRLGARRGPERPDEDAVDITPDGHRRQRADAGPAKPGTRDQPIDEAHVEPADADDDSDHAG